jgi:hypothetical protein
MPANYVLLEKITVGAAGATNITFSGIPQTGYTDLVLKFSARGDAGAISRSVGLQFNGSGTGYANKFLQGDGASATSGSGSSIYLGECTAATATSNTFANQEVYIPNYASSNFKILSVDSAPETNAVTQYLTLVSTTWSNTAAITSINLSIATGNFVQGSTFYLYGVAKLGVTPTIAPLATGGDIIETDGTYWYHAFLSSGTFTPSATALSCDVIVVAGGGSGGNFGGAGGGAGGLLALTSQSISTAQTVTIGAGGAGVAPSGRQGNSGSNSSIGSSIATGGGGGGAESSNGKNGGSGGGAGGGAGGAGAGTGGTAVSGQGFAGGNGGGPSGGGAGGGGASAVGANGTGGETGGNGGIGSNTYSTWASVTGTGASGYYAGGGGGATGSGVGGGTGGAGGGTGGHSGTDATPNTGGGGGGRWNSGTSSAGGSGLVIVRYAV